MHLPRNLLDRPAQEMARLIALPFLDDVAKARQRLTSPDTVAADWKSKRKSRLRCSIIVIQGAEVVEPGA